MIAMSRALLCLCLLLLQAACSWQPIRYDDAAKVKTEEAIAAFSATEALQLYFDDALAYAVFPGSVRAGTGFGGAFGRGWLFEHQEVTGRVQVAEVFAGVDFGAQVYRTILFFRTALALENFKQGRFEFTGQVNATAITAGVALTPSYSQDVAMFVQVRGGLLLEASVGTQRYDYFPLAEPGSEVSGESTKNVKY